MANLTPAEKQDVICFLEADKPLPDKYRFLLFDDKREVELVWNGKTSEVCNVVLPFQVIEQVDEPRSEQPRGGELRGEGPLTSCAAPMSRALPASQYSHFGRDGPSSYGVAGAVRNRSVPGKSHLVSSWV